MSKKSPMGTDEARVMIDTAVDSWFDAYGIDSKVYHQLDFSALDDELENLLKEAQDASND